MIRVILMTAMGLALASCGFTFDMAYLISDQKYVEASTDSTPTQHQVEGLEYEAWLEGDSSVTLACFQRTRVVERRWGVSKTYEYRGGFAPSTYQAAAITDGILGALTAGVLTGICLNEESDVSCTNLVWAAPFAVDMLYSLYRMKSVRDPVLVDKQRSRASLQPAPVPLHEERTRCDSISHLALGRSIGTPDDGQQQRDLGAQDVRLLAEGAIAIPMANGRIHLTPDLVQAWAANAGLALWAVDDRGHGHGLAINRCEALRPHLAVLSSDQRAAYVQQCGEPQSSSQ